MPFVGTVAFAAGPADSVIAVLGLSLENRAFAFQREGNSFVARYRVSLSFKREGAPPVDLAREELVRVATFQETQRADESVLFQQVLRIAPGDLQGDRHRARRLVHLGEQRHRRLHRAQVRQGHLLGADPHVPGHGAGKPRRSGLPGAQPPRRGRLRQRHAARLRRGLLLRRADQGAVRGARRAGAHDLQRLAPVPRGQGSGEPGRPPRARQRLARRAQDRGGERARAERVGAGLVHPGVGGDQLRRDARPAPVLRPRRADRRHAPRPRRRARPALARVLRGDRPEHRHARRTRRSINTSAG